MSASSRSRVLSGRLGARGVGDDDGRPALYFHGTPGSAAEARLLAAAARRSGVHLVAVERPGHGDSAHDADRTLEDWPALALAEADRRGWDRFGVVAWSGGGPYALSLLAAAPERLTAVALFAPSALSPGVRWANRLMPRILLPVHALVARVPELEAAVARTVFAARRLPGPLRRRVQRSPSDVHAAVGSWRRALSQGPAGPIRDEDIITDDWAHVLAQAAAAVRGDDAAGETPAGGVPSARPAPGEAATEGEGAARGAGAVVGKPVPVRIWHGLADHVVPAEASRELAAALSLPEGALTLSEGLGHMDAVLRHGDDAMAFLAAAD